MSENKLEASLVRSFNEIEVPESVSPQRIAGLLEDKPKPRRNRIMIRLAAVAATAAICVFGSFFALNVAKYSAVYSLLSSRPAISEYSRIRGDIDLYDPSGAVKEPALSVTFLGDTFTAIGSSVSSGANVFSVPNGETVLSLLISGDTLTVIAGGDSTTVYTVDPATMRELSHGKQSGRFAAAFSMGNSAAVVTEFEPHADSALSIGSYVPGTGSGLSLRRAASDSIFSGSSAPEIYTFAVIYTGGKISGSAAVLASPRALRINDTSLFILSYLGDNSTEVFSLSIFDMQCRVSTISIGALDAASSPLF